MKRMRVRVIAALCVLGVVLALAGNASATSLAWGSLGHVRVEVLAVTNGPSETTGFNFRVVNGIDAPIAVVIAWGPENTIYQCPAVIPAGLSRVFLVVGEGTPTIQITPGEPYNPSVTDESESALSGPRRTG